MSEVNSPEMYSCSLGTEDFYAYSLLPSAVARYDPEASCPAYQHKTVKNVQQALVSKYTEHLHILEC